MQLLYLILATVTFVSHVLSNAFDHNATDYVHLSARAFEALTNQQRLPWPIVPGSPHNLVRYCYVDALAKVNLQQDLEAAMQAWMNALGGPPSAATQHNLLFMEVRNYNGEEIFCCLKVVRNTATGDTACQWNPALLPDTLVVYWDFRNFGLYRSTVGYTPPSTPVQGVLDRHHRHTMFLSKLDQSPPKKLHKYIHELGHVLGLSHEHQRPDRDDWVIYRCHKLRGFDRCYDRARADQANKDMSDWEVEAQLCSDVAFAMKYNFGGVPFTMDDGERTPIMARPLGAYDPYSIMHYDSLTNVNYDLNDPSKCPGNPAECALVLQSEGRENGQPGVAILTNLLPSNGDVHFVKTYYPWI